MNPLPSGADAGGRHSQENRMNVLVADLFEAAPELEKVV